MLRFTAKLANYIPPMKCPRDSTKVVDISLAMHVCLSCN